METIVAIIVLILSSELWIPLAILFGFLKLIFSFSLIAAWDSGVSVPIWIWDFVHNLI